jgi:Ca2+-binding RTX toxin-like protein
MKKSISGFTPMKGLEELETRTVPTVALIGLNPTNGLLSIVSNESPTSVRVEYHMLGSGVAQIEQIKVIEGANQVIGTFLSGLVREIRFTGGLANDTFNASQFRKPVIADGGPGNDILIGGKSTNTIRGGIGNDNIQGVGPGTYNGQIGDDRITTGPGNDTIDGGEGNDTIVSQGGTDNVIGGLGNDSIRTGSGNDTVDGGDGNDTISTFGGRDSIHGGNGDDTISGGDELDWIYGDDGNDIINGEGGDDSLSGGLGVDRISGGLGNDSIGGGAGNDEINGDEGADAISGGIGNDNIFGGPDNDNIRGEAGDDALLGGLGNDTISGGVGNDSINGHGGDDILNGDEDRDIILGELGRDTISGGSENDLISGGVGNDTINGGTGDDVLGGNEDSDTIHGGEGIDTINGNDGNDSLFGDTESDKINGGNGNDTIEGNDGDDLIHGDVDNDRIRGGNGNDTIYGDNGVDLLLGGEGLDTIYGGNGNDTINGDGGIDTLFGGEGDDWIVAIDDQYFDAMTGNSGRDIFWRDRDPRPAPTGLGGDILNDLANEDADQAVAAFVNRGADRVLNGDRIPGPAFPATLATKTFSANPLFSSNGPKGTDIRQGVVGDCKVVSALAAMARDNGPGNSWAIRKNMVDFGDGTYGLNLGGTFYRVDNVLPLLPGSQTRPNYANLGPEDSIWVAIAEKAIAMADPRVAGTFNYADLSSTGADEVFQFFGSAQTAVPFLSLPRPGGYPTAAALGADIVQRFSGPQPQYLTISLSDSPDEIAANPSTGSPRVPGALGRKFVVNHAYTVWAINTNAQGQLTSVVLRNPWGTDKGNFGVTYTDANANDGLVTITLAELFRSKGRLNWATRVA